VAVGEVDKPAVAEGVSLSPAVGLSDADGLGDAAALRVTLGDVVSLGDALGDISGVCVALIGAVTLGGALGDAAALAEALGANVLLGDALGVAKTLGDALGDAKTLGDGDALAVTDDDAEGRATSAATTGAGCAARTMGGATAEVRFRHVVRLASTGASSDDAELELPPAVALVLYRVERRERTSAGPHVAETSTHCTEKSSVV
jgi:hypothetical protein